MFEVFFGFLLSQSRYDTAALYGLILTNWRAVGKRKRERGREAGRAEQRKIAHNVRAR